MQSTHARPIGPRGISRSQSPAPPPFSVTPPLVIRKQSAQPSSTSSSPPPLLSRPQLPQPRLRPVLKLPTLTAAPAQYYQGPGQIPEELGEENPGSVTVRPPPVGSTARTPRPADPADELANILNRTTLECYTPNEESSSHSHSYDSLKYSDEFLEEISRLGEGQGGAVHKVRDTRTGFVMARKTITTREVPLKQLERELIISSTTKHVNIIRYYGAYMSPSSSEVKVLIEYCPGGSLEAVGKRIQEVGARVGEGVAGRIAEGVLQGLAYLHTLKTIHRDIKPSNILITGEGVVKLCDFGVSGELVRSLAGTFTGTSFYMAPERISGGQYSIRSDVWSTGITLLELVQGRYPFPDDLTPIELLIHITKGEPPQLIDDADTKWGDDMKDFIKQTLIVDDQHRPPPKDMLAHPWVVGMMKREVPMARWISMVWGWSKAHSNSGSSSSKNTSRPSSSRGVDAPA
ncbi:kinase-like protein [Leucogyrophana mollusca]|uniref:Kinase-like protein n=1 Tax=Leucogyrophana mollusca TaxID=85980 RepID=A0ACB8BW65_9AGAM|nr:kinase-like protein [Leucogyrophana mollusca]